MQVGPEQEAVGHDVRFLAHIAMNKGRLKDIDHPATGHCAFASLGVQRAGPKFSLPLALYDGPKSTISDLRRPLEGKSRSHDRLTLMLKPGKPSL